MALTIQELREQYDAVLITIGASTDKKLGLEGEDAEAAGRRERIVLPNQADSILISSLTDKRNVTRNIHMRRTKRYTGYRLVIGTGTTIVLNMAYVGTLPGGYVESFS